MSTVATEEDVRCLSEKHEPPTGEAFFRFGTGCDERTFLKSRYFRYPFHVTRPLYMDHDWHEMATLYLQSVSGGVFEGDRLALSVEVEKEGAVHVTTPSANTVHSMQCNYAIEKVNLTAASGATIEYIPEPFILFPESNFRSQIRIDMHEEAHALITDGMIVHDPAAGAVARFQYYSSETEIRVNRQTVALDRTVIDDADRLFQSMVGMRRHAAQTTVLMVSPRTSLGALLNAVREKLAGCDQVYAGASFLPDGIGVSARILATDGVALRRASNACWAAFRYCTVGRQISKRRK